MSQEGAGISALATVWPPNFSNPFQGVAPHVEKNMRENVFVCSVHLRIVVLVWGYLKTSKVHVGSHRLRRWPSAVRISDSSVHSSNGRVVVCFAGLGLGLKTPPTKAQQNVSRRSKTRCSANPRDASECEQSIQSKSQVPRPAGKYAPTIAQKVTEGSKTLVGLASVNVQNSRKQKMCPLFQDSGPRSAVARSSCRRTQQGRGFRSVRSPEGTAVRAPDCAPLLCGCSLFYVFCMCLLS